MPTTIISLLWNYGSLLGINLVVMIMTGLILALVYRPSFSWLESLIRDHALIRLIHSIGATAFFILLLLHIARGLYYHAYYRTMIWITGLALYLLSLATAFFGYSLPYGQMSYWGSIVITNLLNHDLILWLRGSYSIGSDTLHAFFAIHYLLPFIISSLALLHLMALHLHGSTNPHHFSTADSITFNPYLITKDLVGLFIFIIIIASLLLPIPCYDLIAANELMTTKHILPEWLLLPFLAILRSTPYTLLGLGIAALVLYITGILNFMLLGLLGTMPIILPLNLLARLIVVIIILLKVIVVNIKP